MGDSSEALGAILATLRDSWKPLGSHLGGLEGLEDTILGFLGAFGSILDRLGARLGRLGGALGASWEALGSILAPQELPNAPQISQNPTPKRMAC